MQVKIGNIMMYGDLNDFILIGASGLFGILVDMVANVKFNLCLMDLARLIEMTYAAYYFWSDWFEHSDGSEIVGAIIYMIEGWHVGTNLRCY